MNAEQIQALLDGPWCQPMDGGEHKPRHFLIRFEDQDVGDITTTDEAEARDLWNRYDKNWNCWLFAAMPRSAAPDLAQAALTAMADRDALLKGQTYRYIGKDGKAVLARDLEDQRDTLQARHEDDRQELNRMTVENEALQARVRALEARVKALEAGLALIDAMDPESMIAGCSADAARGLVLRMGETARALLSKGSPDA